MNEEKLILKVDYHRYNLLCQTGGLKKHLETAGFDLEDPMHYDTDKKNGDVTFWQ